ncbi:MAG: NAD-dependent epimerase/dehydratase family protein [Chloroflexi bacterium]|nr:NAD-dependent epimerase/dehydratase family protein [Chloroflexota bacterium]
MRILITGGAGFLGSALAHHLAAQGHRVSVLDDLSAGDPNALSAPRSEYGSSLRGSELMSETSTEISLTRGDVRDIPKLWTLLRDIDCVYHLAARVSVPESILYPVEYNAVNVGGTVSLMAAARDAKVKRVVFASSGTIYGDQEGQPISETAIPHPPNPYAVTKIASEYYVSSLGQLWGIQTVILRIFNAYGPGQAAPPTHAPVIPQFVRQALRGGTLVVYGGGEQSRDFIYVDDVVRALGAAARSPGAVGRMINVGSGRELSIDELVRKLEGLAGRSLSVLHSDAQSGGVSRARADIRLARELLDFQPQVSTEEGLERMLAFYREERAVPHGVR